MTEHEHPLLTAFGAELLRIASEAGMNSVQELCERLTEAGYPITPAELRRHIYIYNVEPPEVCRKDQDSLQG